MKEDIIEGNKIIAEFIGYKYSEKRGCHYTGIRNDETGQHQDYTEYWNLKYHSSWDWLKPVIDKIFIYALAYPEQVNAIRDISIVVDIVHCWEKVVQFITWYNEHKK